MMRYVLKLVVMGHAFLVHQASSFSLFLFLVHRRMYYQAQVHIIITIYNMEMHAFM